MTCGLPESDSSSKNDIVGVDHAGTPTPLSKGQGSSYSQAFRGIRLTSLLGILVAASTLHYWSQQGDPRFYSFLHSPIGSICAQVFGWWGSPLERPLPDKSDRHLTSAERTLKRVIEHSLSHCAEELVDHPYRVRYRDVAFRQEFLETPLYLYPPYAIISDIPRDETDLVARAIREVHLHFRETFSSLMTQAPKSELIHILFFSAEDEYRDYQKRFAHAMRNSSGFYSPSVNRLVLHRQPASTLDQNEAIDLTTMRHEAAHQLFFTFGIHSQHRVENEWLIEGLASYCEPPELGGVVPDQLRRLEDALSQDTIIPITDLVNHRSEGGLLAYKPAELAYAQAWSLVHFLMSNERRAAFFAYIRYLRTPQSFSEISEKSRIEILCRYLGISPTQLDQDWTHYVEDLVRKKAGES